MLRGLPLSSLAACPTPEWCLFPKFPQELEDVSCQPPQQVWDTPNAGNKPFSDNVSEFSGLAVFWIPSLPPFMHSLFFVSLQNQNWWRVGGRRVAFLPSRFEAGLPSPCSCFSRSQESDRNWKSLVGLQKKNATSSALKELNYIEASNGREMITS